MKAIRLKFFLLLFSVFTSTYIFAQKPAVNPNEEHDKFIELYQKSAAVVLPDSVYRILKDYAFTKGYSEALVLKNEYLIKIIYNSDLTNKERIYACNKMMNDATLEKEVYFPVFLFKNMKEKLEKNGSRKKSVRSRKNKLK